MNETLRFLASDLLELREKTGLTQLEVTTLAGDPCRTYLAHLEQGRRKRLNLPKLQAILTILLKRKGTPMTTELEQLRAEMRNSFAAIRSEIEDLRKDVGARSASSKEPLPPEGVLYTEAVDKVMFQRMGKNLHFREVIDILIESKQALRLHNGQPVTFKKNPEKPNEWLPGVVGTYLGSSKVCAVLSQVDPAKTPNKKFIRLSRGLYTANKHYRHPIEPVTAQLTLKALS